MSQKVDNIINKAMGEKASKELRAKIGEVLGESEQKDKVEKLHVYVCHDSTLACLFYGL